MRIFNLKIDPTILKPVHPVYGSSSKSVQIWTAIQKLGEEYISIHGLTYVYSSKKSWS